MAHLWSVTDSSISPDRMRTSGDDQTPLGEMEEARLAHLIEAGVLARAALDTDDLPVGASRTELAQIVAEGDAARQRFLLSHTRFVWSIALPEAHRLGLDPDDLVQEGFVELSRALQSFDPQKGRFSSYAYRGVRARIHAAATGRNGASGLPADRALTLRQARAIEARLTAETGQVPSMAQVAKELGRSPAWTADLLNHQFPTLMGDSSMVENIAGPNSLDEPEEHPGVAAGLMVLSTTQRLVVSLRFGFSDDHPRSYREIGEQMGMSWSSARRVCESALAVLRQTAAAVRDQQDGEGPGSSLASPEQMAMVPRIDRLTGKGLSLLEVAMAMKTGPRQIVEACRAGGRKDLMARLTGFELRMSGPRPAGTDVLAEAIRRDTRIRRAQQRATGIELTTSRLRDIIAASPTVPEAHAIRLMKQTVEPHHSGRRPKTASGHTAQAVQSQTRPGLLPVTPSPSRVASVLGL